MEQFRHGVHLDDYIFHYYSVRFVIKMMFYFFFQLKRILNECLKKFGHKAIILFSFSYI